MLLGALGAVAALIFAALFALPPAAADGHPDDLDLVLSLVDDSDHVVPPGGEFSVQAELHFSAPHSLGPHLNLASANLRLSGSLYWEENLAGRLDIEEQVAVGGHGLVPVEADGSPLPAVTTRFSPSGKAVAKALDQRTLVVLARPRLGGSWPNYDEPLRLHIFDTWNKRQAAVIPPPAGVTNRDRFGSTNGIDFSRGIAVAVWHDTADTAWLFVGSPEDTVGGNEDVGGIYIYRLDWRQEPLGVELVNTLRPPLSEAGNRWGANHTAYYGTSMTISEDGSTLAVGAHQIDAIGAIYVYTRPSGNGLDWGDLDYADGVKVTTVQTATWGSSSSTAPFDGGALSTCDVYCSRIWASQRTNLAKFTVGLSADGRVLAAGAGFKGYASSTPGGSFDDTNRRSQRGEAYVWLAPEGGWAAAPRASQSGKTLIAAKADASSFDPELHYSPGPDRRVSEPDAVLLSLPWSNTDSSHLYFGRGVAVSPDGSTVAISAGRPGHIHIFQRNSASDWADAGELFRTARLTDLTTVSWIHPGEHGDMAFSRDGQTLAIGDDADHPPGAAYGESYIGRVLLFSPSGGVWRDAALSDARILRQPGGGLVNAKYAFPLYGLSGQRMATSSIERGHFTIGHGQIWLSDGGCTVRVVDGAGAWTCPIDIETPTNAVIPPGTPEGRFTLSGRATLSWSDDPDSVISLDDRVEVEIADVKEVAELKFGFPVDDRGTSSTADDRPFPSTLEGGEATTMRLQILNARGKPPSSGSLESLWFITNEGSLSTNIEGGCLGQTREGLTCHIDVSQLNTSNSGEILLTLRHRGRAATANVSATVVTAEAEHIVSESLAVLLTGPPAAISIAAPTAGVLNVNAESMEGAEARGNDLDNRDRLTLSVTASDAGGHKVKLPTGTRRAAVIGPDGERITDGIAIEWPLGGRDSPTLDKAGDPQVRVNINRAASAKLANGEYTLELRAGELIARQTFSVSGDPAAVALSDPEGELTQDGRFTITARVTDTDGAAVPDGTPITWRAAPIGDAPVLVRLVADRATIAGAASATYLNVTPGSAYIHVMTGGISGVKLVTVGGISTPQGVAGSLGLGQQHGLNTWLGPNEIAASALVAALDQVGAVRILHDVIWISYAINEDGWLVSSSEDFTIEPGAVIWLGP